MSKKRRLDVQKIKIFPKNSNTVHTKKVLEEVSEKFNTFIVEIWKRFIEKYIVRHRNDRLTTL